MTRQHEEPQEHPATGEVAAHDEQPSPAADGGEPDHYHALNGSRWQRWLAIGLTTAVLLTAAFALTGGLNARGEEAAGTKAADGGDAASAEGAEGTGTEGEENGEKAEEETPAVPVELATVGTEDIASYITATTNLVAEGEVMVLSEVEGRVTRVARDEGDFVEKGQILATLDREDAEIALEKARVREENAKTVYDRGRTLAEDELISAEDLDKRRLDYELARQERAEAEWRLAKTEIRAPISGRVSERSTQQGQHVRPGDELFQITDFDPLLARIYLPEKDVLSLSPGRRVEMSLDAAPDVTFTGRVRQIAPVVDPATGTVKVTLEAQSVPSPVRPGSFVTVRVVREERPGAVVVPKDAVLRELQQAHVFVARGEGDDMVAARRAVTLGLEDGDRVQATSGVEPGERLVVAGQGSLSDGERIRTLDADPQES